MRSTPSPAKRTATYGLFLAAALLFSYVEVLLPLPFMVPGMKLGLANIVILVVLYAYGVKSAALISLMRVLLSGLLFGNFYSFVFSLAGATLSLLVMWACYRALSIYTVSMLGGVSHNIGQFIAAALMIDNFNIAFYLPLLILSGLCTGLLTSVLAKVIIKNIGKLPE